MRAIALLAVFGACVPTPPSIAPDALVPAPDAAPQDAAPEDAAPEDAALEDAADPEDAGTPEDAAPDAGPPDSGVPPQCPADPNAACHSAGECAADIPAPTNCAACVASNRALCAEGSCEMPPTLDPADIHAIAVQVPPTVPLLESIGSFALAERTAGTRVISCADVYAGTVDLTDRCYNVLESRSLGIGQAGDTYTVSFGGFASGQRTLFIVLGFTQTGARGDPVGISCSEIDVGPPRGGEVEFFAGDPMRPL